ncbi:hypothetical protein N0V93_009005 [Gnomoniopsis smithogilvyi]|uniref:Uncharacterized protein n=1 Tax=Gnomoniopsis smithogilvyi TaxID=1191159 RepID=A0A9W9CT85_9PEZI|nr:hypothetical protein N0V93_009005 [Gnomoniopsis smithogilvyi]
MSTPPASILDGSSVASSFSPSAAASTPATSFAAPEPEYVDKYNIERYIFAQDKKDIYNRVLAAFRAGRRKPQPATWIWCVFPQMNECQTAVAHRRRDNLIRDKWPPGHAMEGGLDEARAILQHPILGPRIRAAAGALVDSPAVDVFSVMDNMFYDVARLHSSITLFRQAARYPVCIHVREARVGENHVFRKVLDKYFIREPDSEDEDYDEEEENTARTQGSRHGPTLERLDALELQAAEKRLAAGEPCVCGLDRDKIICDDIGSKFKIMDRQRDRLTKNVGMQNRQFTPAQLSALLQPIPNLGTPFQGSHPPQVALRQVQEAPCDNTNAD